MRPIHILICILVGFAILFSLMHQFKSKCPPGQKGYFYGCDNCTDRSYTDTNNKNFNCIPCKDNHYPNEEHTKCLQCPDGKYAMAPNKVDECEPCLGIVTDISGLMRCQTCPDGQIVTLNNGLIQCKTCPDGQEPNDNNTECTPTPS